MVEATSQGEGQIAVAAQPGAAAGQPTVTAAIIARDEATNLGPCLAGLAWADARLVLLDDRTRDTSAAVAAAHGAAVVAQRFRSFPVQRNAALDWIAATAATDWVLFVDADERVTASLAAAVRSAIGRAGPEAPVGYWIPRRNFIWGAWIRHGGWHPDYQLRLLRVGAARYDEARDVHEVVQLAGAAEPLSEPFLHYNYDGFRQFLRKQRQYARLEGQRLARAGVRVGPRQLLVQPLRELRYRLIGLRGYRDGWRGLALAVLLAGYTVVAYLDRRRYRSS
jgi:glycosyltransferase involved in cell wall biosynthesis